LKRLQQEVDLQDKTERKDKVDQVDNESF